jgi:hypothetical protein
LNCSRGTKQRRENTMGGFITKKTVVTNAVLIIRLYGFRAFVACLRAKQGSTFLGVLVACGRI